MKIRSPIILAVLLIMNTPNTGRADTFGFTAKEIPVVVHEKRSSGVRLYGNKGRGQLSELSVHVFSAEDLKRLNGAGTYDALPECSKSAVRRAEVFHSSDQSRIFDVIYYSRDNQTHRRRAAEWPGITVPFIESANYNPYFGKSSELQCFARLVDIRCLPTRFHFVENGGQRYREYREGESAWDLLPEDFSNE